LILAVLFLALAHWVLYGEVLPVDAAPFRWGWLGLSAVSGLALGDSFLFQAFLFIGTRRAMLTMTLVPVISALVAWGWLGETLRPLEIGAMLLTIAGVAWVVSERQPVQSGASIERRQYFLGMLMALAGASGQAMGLVLSKRGLVGDFPSLSATLIRMLVGSVVIWLLTLVRRQVRATGDAMKDKRAWLFIVGGSLTGPFLGVWLSMTAVQHAQVGIASTLMALSPIMVIPLARWAFRERISPRAVAGTVVALLGAAAILMT